MISTSRIYFLAFLAVASGLSPSAPAIALTQQQIDQCVNSGNIYSLTLQISACTAAIDSGRWRGKKLAEAYYNRGYAYQDAGDDNRAITDYTQSIQLDPKYTLAYFQRGTMYQDKGNYL